MLKEGLETLTIILLRMYECDQKTLVLVRKYFCDFRDIIEKVPDLLRRPHRTSDEDVKTLKMIQATLRGLKDHCADLFFMHPEYQKRILESLKVIKRWEQFPGESRNISSFILVELITIWKVSYNCSCENTLVTECAKFLDSYFLKRTVMVVHSYWENIYFKVFLFVMEQVSF